MTSSVDFIKEKIGDFSPDLLIILGSGLSNVSELLEKKYEIPYSDIPNFKPSTAPTHLGKLIFGTCGGHNIMIMSGRLHPYEGYSYSEVCYPLLVANELGVKSVIITCATGGITPGLSVSEIVLIKDHINLVGATPLSGASFIDMTNAYTKRLRDAVKSSGFALKECVYGYMKGPQYETPSEIAALRTLGADIVGMSVVCETIMANYLKMEVLAFSVVTNLAAGLSDSIDAEHVTWIGKNSSNELKNIIHEVLNTI